MSVRPLPAFAAGASLLVLLVGCGKAADDDLGASPTATTPSAAATTVPSRSPDPTAPPSSTLPPGVGQLITITYDNGTVTGPRGRVKVKKSTVLRIVVTSDKADEVHLHGYDKLVEVAAGGTAQITVKATISGVFAVELEKRKVVLTRIQVQ